MRKKRLLFMVIVGGLFVLQLSAVNAAEKVQVVVSIPPQTYFVRQIGGDLVDVISMLPEGGFPHTYEPTPKQMKLLSKADMYVRIRVEFENAWWEKMLAANPDMYVVDSTVGIDFIEGQAHDYHKDADKSHKQDADEIAQRRDPHIWLSPKMVKLQGETICEGLIYVDPKNKATYTTNKEAFLKALDDLDRDIQEMLANLKTRKFMVFHPSWAYFARDYNLEQIPIEIEGKEPSAVEMTTLMETAKDENIRVIFVQPQTSRRSVEIIAKQIGANVEILNPLAINWMENMRTVAETLAKVLGED